MMRPTGGKVLVVAAHPDDEVLGCGGTIARLSQEGYAVYITILGEGITSRYPLPGQADRTLVEAFRARSREAVRMLGVKEVFQHDLPDNRFDTVPLLEVIKIIEKSIARLRPDAIYTHHGGDLNVDHTVVHRAVLTATRAMKGQTVRELYAFEVPSATEWAFQSLAPTFRPNFFVDISGSLKLKVRALSCYKTEIRTFPHPRSPRAIKAIAQRWGSIVGCDAAEAFELIRGIKLGGNWE